MGASSNQHDWTPVEYLNVLHHDRTIEHQSSCYAEIFYYTYKILFLIILLKSFMVECLEFFLTPIRLNKIVSALKEFITSDLLNTKILVLQRRN